MSGSDNQSTIANLFVAVSDALNAADSIVNTAIFVCTLQEYGNVQEDLLSGMPYLIEVAEAASALDLITQRLLWEPESDTAESWAPESDTSAIWTNSSDNSSNWTIINDTPDTWTPVTDGSTTWTPI